MLKKHKIASIFCGLILVLFAMCAQAQNLPTAPFRILVQEQVRPPATPLARQLGLRAASLAIASAPEAGSDNPIFDGPGEGNFATPGANFMRSTNQPVAIPNIHGTLSVQDFRGTQSNLHNTHASTDGFRAYLEKFYPANYIRRDSGVSVWLYHDKAEGENYDLWSSGGMDYGIDAVRVAWHSGHGGMSNNVFYAPMGNNWAGRGWDAVSNQMFLGGNHDRFGDERLRYMFWDTCNSVMVSGGNTPMRTWGARSKGVRMVFGYETVSIDASNYGSAFWDEWKKGKSLTNAFLDASWYHVSQDQSPAVVAFGATREEATDRLNNERYFFGDAVTANWASWRWYAVRRGAANDRNLQQLQLSQTNVRQVVAQGNSDEEMTALARAFGINLADPQMIQTRPAGVRGVFAQGVTLLVEENGNFELSLRLPPARDVAAEEMTDEALIRRAEEITSLLSFFNHQEARVGLIRDLNENEGTADFEETPRVMEKTVVFDQMIDGLAFIDPKAGHLEVTFDARTGQVKHLRSTLLKIAAPDKNQATAQRRSLDEAREAAVKSIAALAKAGESPEQLEIMPETESVGYYLLNGKAVPVYRAHLRNPRFVIGRSSQAIIPMTKDE